MRKNDSRHLAQLPEERISQIPNLIENQTVFYVALAKDVFQRILKVRTVKLVNLFWVAIEK